MQVELKQRGELLYVLHGLNHTLVSHDHHVQLSVKEAIVAEVRGCVRAGLE